MRVVEINMTSQGSTGTIMKNISSIGKQEGITIQMFSTIRYTQPREEKKVIENHNYYGSYFENILHTIFGKVTGLNGLFSYFGTKQLIKKIKKFNPCIVHLHNLHQFCINLPLLFRFLKKKNIKTIWTLHDCWAFTGHCPHFLISKCEKWKTGCFECPQFNRYPKTYIDRSAFMYKMKKKWFRSLDRLTIVTPSQWLANIVEQSFLNKYRIETINNGIDLDVFKPTNSFFRYYNNCLNKKIVLGVAMGWGYSKGIDVFIELSKRLDEEFQIVLVGTNEHIDRLLPSNIISIHQTENQTQLAEIYTAADIFVNPTREDTFPTVNIEAIACGTPVITFMTGGSPETINDKCGSAVKCDDIDALEYELLKLKDSNPYSKDECIRYAQNFDKNKKLREYITLYENITYCTKCNL